MYGDVGKKHNDSLLYNILPLLTYVRRKFFPLLPSDNKDLAHLYYQPTSSSSLNNKFLFSSRNSKGGVNQVGNKKVKAEWKLKFPEGFRSSKNTQIPYWIMNSSFNEARPRSKWFGKFGIFDEREKEGSLKRGGEIVCCLTLHLSPCLFVYVEENGWMVAEKWWVMDECMKETCLKMWGELLWKWWLYRRPRCND